MQGKKPQLSAKYRLWKNPENLAKMVKNYRFCRFFLFFFRNFTLQRAEVFCVAFSASKPFIWAITINNPTIFHIFYPKGGPFWFGGVKILPTREVEGLERKERQFKKWHGLRNKMGGCRSLGFNFSVFRHHLSVTGVRGGILIVSSISSHKIILWITISLEHLLIYKSICVL